MPELTLSADEVEMLRDVLTSYLSDLRMEIAGTDAMDFREGLKRREVFLKRVLHDLDAEAPRSGV